MATQDIEFTDEIPGLYRTRLAYYNTIELPSGILIETTCRPLFMEEAGGGVIFLLFIFFHANVLYGAGISLENTMGFYQSVAKIESADSSHQDTDQFHFNIRIAFNPILEFQP